MSITKPFITLVHGFSHNRKYFDPLVGILSEQFQVLAVDLPGHGENSSHPGPFHWGTYAGYIRDFWQKNHVQKTWYWGTHTGAGLGLYLAGQADSPIEAMILEAPSAPGISMPRTKQILSSCQRLARSAGMEAALKLWWEGSEWFASLQRRSSSMETQRIKAITQEFTGRPWLEDDPEPSPLTPIHWLEINIPIFVYNGQGDLPEFLDVSHFLAKQLPEVTRKILPGLGGFPLGENPLMVWESVENWLFQQKWEM